MLLHVTSIVSYFYCSVWKHYNVFIYFRGNAYVCFDGASSALEVTDMDPS